MRSGREFEYNGGPQQQLNAGRIVVVRAEVKGVGAGKQKLIPLSEARVLSGIQRLTFSLGLRRDS